MKKTFSVLAVLLVIVMALSATVFAESQKTDENWGVTLTADGKMTQNFSLSDFNDAIYKMQPGDDITITLKLKNNYSDQSELDWYMENEVMKSLEEASKTAAGGAYTYMLSYKSPNKATEDVFFQSDSVGGEGYVSKDLEGLYSATDSLKDFFYLDTLKTGQEGLVTLKVALEGETQGNGYQDTLAKLRMKFAVELPKNDTVIITGEQVHPLPLIIIASVSGALLLALVIVGLRLRKSERKEAVR